MSRRKTVEPEVQIINMFEALSADGQRIVAGFIRNRTAPPAEPKKKSSKKAAGLPKSNSEEKGVITGDNAQS